MTLIHSHLIHTEWCVLANKGLGELLFEKALLWGLGHMSCYLKRIKEVLWDVELFSSHSTLHTSLNPNLEVLQVSLKLQHLVMFHCELSKDPWYKWLSMEQVTVRMSKFLVVSPKGIFPSDHEWNQIRTGKYIRQMTRNPSSLLSTPTLSSTVTLNSVSMQPATP